MCCEPASLVGCHQPHVAREHVHLRNDDRQTTFLLGGGRMRLWTEQPSWEGNSEGPSCPEVSAGNCLPSATEPHVLASV